LRSELFRAFSASSLRVAVLSILDQENHQKSVTIVVPVLMTSCHVSLKLKNGPVIAQARIIPVASAKAAGLAATLDVQEANRLKHDEKAING
jgi:hypothetical protein